MGKFSYFMKKCMIFKDPVRGGYQDFTNILLLFKCWLRSNNSLGGGQHIKTKKMLIGTPPY